MSDDFDLSLFGDSLVKPSTGEEADPIDVLADKVVRSAPDRPKLDGLSPVLLSR